MLVLPAKFPGWIFQSERLYTVPASRCFLLGSQFSVHQRTGNDDKYWLTGLILVHSFSFLADKQGLENMSNLLHSRKSKAPHDGKHHHFHPHKETNNHTSGTAHEKPEAVNQQIQPSGNHRINATRVEHKIPIWAITKEEEHGGENETEPSPYLEDTQKCLDIITSVASSNADEHTSATVQFRELAHLCWLGSDEVQDYLRGTGLFTIWTGVIASCSTVHKQSIMEVVTECARQHRANQNELARTGWIQLLSELLLDEVISTRQWAGQTLFVILSNNAKCQTIALKLAGLKDNLRVAADADWSDWNYNAAEQVIELLGFQPEEILSAKTNANQNAEIDATVAGSATSATDSQMVRAQLVIAGPVDQRALE